MRGIYRKVDLSIWTDEKVRKLSRPSPNGLSLWQYLLAAKESIIIPGVIPVGLGAIADTLHWPLAGTAKAFAEIEALGLAKADLAAGLIWVPKAINHNPPASPNVIKHWSKAWRAVPECPLRSEVVASLKASVDGMHPGFQKAFRQVFGESFQEAFVEAKPQAMSEGVGDGTTDALPEGIPKAFQEGFGEGLPEDMSKGLPEGLPHTGSSEQGAGKEAVTAFSLEALKVFPPASATRPTDEPTGGHEVEPPDDDPRAACDAQFGALPVRDVSHLGRHVPDGHDVPASDERSRELHRWSEQLRKSRGKNAVSPPEDLADWYLLAQLKRGFTDDELRDAYLHFLDGWGLERAPDGRFRDGSLRLFRSSEAVWLDRALELHRVAESESRPVRKLIVKRGGR